MERTIFDDEHEQFRAAVRQFLTREVVERNDAFERAGIVDRDVFLAAGAAGFLGFAVPEEHGGGGVRDFRYNAVLGEEAAALGLASVGLGLTIALNAMARSIGQTDLYPFVLSPNVVEKLDFVHRAIGSQPRP